MPQYSGVRYYDELTPNYTPVPQPPQQPQSSWYGDTFTWPNAVRFGSSVAGDFAADLATPASILAAPATFGASLLVPHGIRFSGGAVGETVGRFMEGKEYNPWISGIEGGMNMLPGPRIPGAKAGIKEILGYMGKSGISGAGQGMAGAIPRHMADEGQIYDDKGGLNLPGPERLGVDTLAGFAFGGATGGGLAGGRRALESIGHTAAAPGPQYKPGDFSPIPDQYKLPGMGGVDFEQKSPVSLYDRPVQAPNVDQARAQSAIDVQSQQRIFELQVRQSEAKRAGDWGAVTQLEDEILRARTDASVAKRNWQPPTVHYYDEMPGRQAELPGSRIEGEPPSTLGTPFGPRQYKPGDFSPVFDRPQPTQSSMTYGDSWLPFSEPLPMGRPPQVETPPEPDIPADYRQIPIQFRGSRGQFMNQPPPRESRMIPETMFGPEPYTDLGPNPWISNPSLPTEGTPPTQGQFELPFDPNVNYQGVPRTSPFQVREQMPPMSAFANVPQTRTQTPPPPPVEAPPVTPPPVVSAPPPQATGEHMVSTRENPSPGPRPPEGVVDDRPVTVSLPYPDSTAVRLLKNDGYVSISGLRDENGAVMMVRADMAGQFGGRVTPETPEETALATRDPNQPVAPPTVIPPVMRPEIPSAIPAGNRPANAGQEIRVPVAKAKSRAYLTNMKAGGWELVGKTETEAIFRKAPEAPEVKKPGLFSRLAAKTGDDTGSTTIFNDFGEWVVGRFRRDPADLSPERRAELEERWNTRIRALPSDMRAITNETDPDVLRMMRDDYAREVTINERNGNQDQADHTEQLMLAAEARIEVLDNQLVRESELNEVSTMNDPRDLRSLLNYWNRQADPTNHTPEEVAHAISMSTAIEQRTMELSSPSSGHRPTDPDFLSIQAANTVQQAEDLVRYWNRQATDIHNDTSSRLHAADMRNIAQARAAHLSAQAPANQPLSIGGSGTVNQSWLNRASAASPAPNMAQRLSRATALAAGGNPINTRTLDESIDALGNARLYHEARIQNNQNDVTIVEFSRANIDGIDQAVQRAIDGRYLTGQDRLDAEVRASTAVDVFKRPSRGRMKNDQIVHVGKSSPEVEQRKMLRLKKVLLDAGITSIPPLNPNRLTRNISHPWAKQQLSYIPPGRPGIEKIHAQAGTSKSDPNLYEQTHHIIYRDSKGQAVTMADVYTYPDPTRNDVPVFASDIDSPAYSTGMFNVLMEIAKLKAITTHGSYSPHTARMVDRFRQALATEDLPIQGEPSGVIINDIFNVWRTFKDGLPGLVNSLKSSKAREMAEMLDILDASGANDAAYAPIVRGKAQPGSEGTKWRDTVLNQVEQLETNERAKLAAEVAEEAAQGIQAPKESPFIEVRNLARGFMNSDDTGSILNPITSIGQWAKWGKGGASSIRKTKDEGKVGESYLDEVLGLPKNSTTWGDYSPSLKQALNFIHTQQFRDAIWPMIKAGWDKSHWDKYMNEIKSKPMFQRSFDENTGKWSPSWSEKVNFKLLDIGEKLSERGEMIGSTWIENGRFFGIPDNPVSRFYANSVGRLTRGSNRSFAMIINHIGANRLEWFADRARDMSAQGVDTGEVSLGAMDAMFRTKTKVNPEEAMDLNPYHNLVLGKDMADMIKTALGKAPLKTHILPHPSWEVNLEAGAKWWSRIFFAPRLIASRFRMLNPSTYIMATPQVRKEYLKSAVAGAAMWLGMTKMLEMAAPMVTDGVDVSWDPDSADFGKIRIRNTRLDFGGGYLPYLVSIHRLWSGLFTSSSTGKSQRYGAGYQAQTQEHQLQRVGENKFDPLVKMGYDFLSAADYKPFHVYDRTAQLFVPLVAQDMWELLQKDPGLLGMAMPAVLFGAGTQTYQKGESVSKFIPAHRDKLIRGGGLRDALPGPVRRVWDDTWREIGIGGR